MSVVCAFCGGRFDGVGPSRNYGHDGTMCALDTTKKLRSRNAALETALRRITELSDMDMKDGDAAREIAQIALST